MSFERVIDDVYSMLYLGIPTASQQTAAVHTLYLDRKRRCRLAATHPVGELY